MYFLLTHWLRHRLIPPQMFACNNMKSRFSTRTPVLKTWSLEKTFSKISITVDRTTALDSGDRKRARIFISVLDYRDATARRNRYRFTRYRRGRHKLYFGTFRPACLTQQKIGGGCSLKESTASVSTSHWQFQTCRIEKTKLNRKQQIEKFVRPRRRWM